MMRFIALIVLLVITNAVEIDDVHTWFDRPYSKHKNRPNSGLGKHKFPYSQELSNELQLIKPMNIIKSTDTTSESQYIILDVAPRVIKNDEVVVVSYYSTTPNLQKYGDWIGAYSPADVDITKTVPVKWGYCDEDDDYVANGYGSLNFNLTNLRADVKFYYFTSGTYYPVMVNKSESTVTFENINEPLRPRVVPTGDPDVFSLLWSSATSASPQLQWGEVKGTYANIVDAVTSVINRADMPGAFANSTGWRDLGLLHTASLQGMVELSSKTIYYRFGDKNTNDWSREYTFLVPPKAGSQPPTRPTRVILFDDLGRGSTDDTYTWNEYGRPSIELTMALGPEVSSGMVDAIYHGGDISYATGYMAVWDFYLDQISNVASGAIYLTTVGNHESDCPNSASYYAGSSKYGRYGDSGGECGVAATRLIPMPAPATTNQPW